MSSLIPPTVNKPSLRGRASLRETHPDLAAQWSPENEFTPDDFSSGSGESIWWICPNGHRFNKCIVQRVISTTSAKGCTECYAKMKHTLRTTATNNLKNLFPDLVRQWSPKNETGPETYTPSSLEKVWWICELGHEFYSRIEGRTRGKGCSECNNHHNKLPDEYNLESMYPELMKEWSPQNTLDPSQMYPGSAEIAFWICGKGHEWSARISKRAQARQNCRTCVARSRRLKPGINDLLTTAPHLEEGWSPRNDRPFEEFTYASGQLVWWHCKKCDCDWQETPHLRFFSKSNCPSCFPYAKTVSQAEQEIASIIEELGFQMKTSNRSVLGRKELDIYLPDQSVAIEFNGIYWHSDLYKSDNYHAEKTKACGDRGIRLIHVWEDDWKHRRGIVLRSLFSKLNSMDKAVQILGSEFEFSASYIDSEECEVTKVSKQDSQDFLDKNHIQGFASGSIKIGLRTKRDNLLVAVLIGSRSGNEIHIERYADSCIVSGGFAKLTKALESKASSKTVAIVAFEEYEGIHDSLYEDEGWIVDYICNPDFMYFPRGWDTRFHKSSYTMKYMRENSEFKYADGFSEREIAELNGIQRVYDAGKVRFIKHIEPATIVEEESMVSHI